MKNTVTASRPGLKQTAYLLIGAILSIACFYWLLLSSALPEQGITNQIEIHGARYFTAFLVGILAAHIAQLLFAQSGDVRPRIMALERHLLVGAATVLAVLAVYLHFGIVWSSVPLTAMGFVFFLSTRSGLPLFVENGIAGFTWGVMVGAMVYLYMSSASPVSLTQLLTGNLVETKLWQPVLLGLVLLTILIGRGVLSQGEILSKEQMPIALFLLGVALVGYLPFIISFALMSRAALTKLFPHGQTLNYFLVASICLVAEGYSARLLAGNSLPLGLTLTAVFLPIIMGSLALSERGWRLLLNLVAITIVAFALWLVLFLNYANFIGQIV